MKKLKHIYKTQIQYNIKIKIISNLEKYEYIII